MLPGFCVGPLDLVASFKGIARALGNAINERPDLRLTICQALRTIITKSCNTGRPTHKTNTQAEVKPTLSACVRLCLNMCVCLCVRAYMCVHVCVSWGVISVTG